MHKHSAIIALLLFGSSITLADPPSFDEFVRGEFSIHRQRGTRASSLQIEQVVNNLKHTHALRRVKDAIIQSDDDSLNTKTASLNEHRDYEDFLFLSTYIATAKSEKDSGFATLLLAASSVKWNEAQQRTVLKELQKNPPPIPPWQRAILSLIESDLTIFSASNDEKQKARISSVQRLIQAYPKYAMTSIPEEKNQMLSDLYTFSPPIGAALQARIAAIHLNIATSSQNVDEEALNRAHKAASKVSKLYPDSVHAQWANELIQRRIPMMRSLRE